MAKVTIELADRPDVGMGALQAQLSHRADGRSLCSLKEDEMTPAEVVAHKTWHHLQGELAALVAKFGGAVEGGRIEGQKKPATDTGAH